MPFGKVGDLVQLESSSGKDTLGVVLNMWSEVAWVRLLGKSHEISVGASGSKLADKNAVITEAGIPVGEKVLGRVVDARMQPLDGKGPLNASKSAFLGCWQPHISDRLPIDKPFTTGIKAVDSLTPLGKGQSLLVYGEKGTGKTTLALDAILAQNDKEVTCVYVSLAQGDEDFARTLQTLERSGALEHTLVMRVDATNAADLFGAPFTAVTIAESFRDEKKDCVIVYDDLNPHINLYTELCDKLDGSGLLVDRHILWRTMYSGLIQRSARLNNSLGGGSLTSMLLLQTPDIGPDEMMSVSDGQICLSQAILDHGPCGVPVGGPAEVTESQNFRPPVDIAKSQSRIGNITQPPALRMLCSTLRNDLLQELDADKLKHPKDRGHMPSSRLMRYFQQSCHSPVPLVDQILSLFPFRNPKTSFLLETLPVDQISTFQAGFLQFVKETQPGAVSNLREHDDLQPIDELMIRMAVAHYCNEYFHKPE
eukprot:CAMPEP_0175131070 /NCGR_PEP_ID=MMETSP0087-20121206/6339_1 /TAXON_ID=136419 /ORGANISM="Unknown Unknown, Strain D1" /LENGTH=480 /DNA_ID=CAMNT_0016413321 /DNA_START=187 /DNA_END=1629 /DNA_ORIENTATION=-